MKAITPLCNTIHCGRHLTGANFFLQQEPGAQIYFGKKQPPGILCIMESSVTGSYWINLAELLSIKPIQLAEDLEVFPEVWGQIDKVCRAVTAANGGFFESKV